MPQIQLTPRDRLHVVQLDGRYSVAVTLAPGARPTTQTDDLDERLVHEGRFRTFAGALRLQARVARAQRIDVTRWTWTPREHGRFVAEPVATPYEIDR